MNKINNNKKIEWIDFLETIDRIIQEYEKNKDLGKGIILDYILEIYDECKIEIFLVIKFIYN